MKVESKQEFKVSGTINKDRETIGLTLDEDATEHLMGLLTDLYADPEEAVLREYSTNARDSHIEAGIDRPIEVTLPSALNPVLKIQDFGIGLDKEDIKNIYTKYGASTKRETNDATGMLGLGCKSALSYCDQFSIIAIKNGRRIEANVFRNEKGSGELTILKETDTDKENGVSILIPSRNSSTLRDKAMTLFKYWPRGTVLIDGKEPPVIEGIKFDNFILSKTNTYYERKNTIVMGGVPYPATFNNLNLPGYAYRLIAEVPIGSVHFTPSREELMDTPRTKETIARIEKEFKEGLKQYVEKRLKEPKTKEEFLKMVEEMIDFLPNVNNLTYEGNPVPKEFRETKKKDNPINPYGYVRTTRYAFHWGYKSKTSDVDHIPFLSWNKYYWVENFDVKFSLSHRNRLGIWVEENNIETQNLQWVFLEGKAPDHIKDWVDSNRIIDWTEIKKLKKKKDGTAYKPNDSYDLLRNDSSGVKYDGVTADELNKAKNVVYFNALKSYGDGSDYVGLAKTVLKKDDPDVIMITVGLNRQDKMKRLVPHAKAAPDKLKEVWEAWLKKLSAKDKRALNQTITNYGYVSRVKEIKIKNLKDPIAKKYIEQNNYTAENFSNIHGSAIGPKKQELMTEYKRWVSLGYRITDEEWNEQKTFKERYPLIDLVTLDSTTYPELEIYANAKYEIIQRKETV